MALSVIALWGCFVAERMTMRRALAEQARVMRDLHRLRSREHTPVPVSAPVHKPKRPRATAG
jgi:hypothetical protein